MRPSRPNVPIVSTSSRIRWWYSGLLLIMAVFVVRLFYLQVIRHDHYEKAALSSQLKQYEIPAERGGVSAHYGDKVTPIVLNEVRYTLYVDPKFVIDPATTAARIQKIVGGDTKDYQDKMTKAGSRYQILAKKLSVDQKDAIIKLKLKGVGAQPVNYRTYPQGSLASQLLGYVNDDGIGTYGLEQALDPTLKGKPGQLKAITDASGVPLAANKDNLIQDPIAGKDVVLTIDIGLQSQLEDILKSGLDKAKSSSGGALIMDTTTGAIKAMANYPTYNPAEYYKVDDAKVFSNATVSAPLEIGSVMKPLTAASALDQGVVNDNTTYYDPSQFTVDGYKITNIEEDGGAGTRNVADILQLSLNTGATWLLMQMGGGQINQKARVAWHNYMVDHYGFGQLTGIEQGYESGGSIPDPIKGSALNLQYANTAFGQGMSATPLQLAAALSSVVNGGTYYKPHLVDAYVNADGSQDVQKPVVVRKNVVKETVGADIVGLMENVINKNWPIYGMSQPNPRYAIGGKTGTAQVAKPTGGYYDNVFNGMFMGFVGGNKPEYVIVVRVDEPKIAGYAGSKAAAPIFGHLVDLLINNYGVKPKV